MAKKKTKVVDVVKAEPADDRSSVAGGHLKALGAIPESAADNPVEWADKFLESLVPWAAKEKEWQLKFGTEAKRDAVASEILAMRSISAKKEQGVNVAAVINLIPPANNPFAQVVNTTANAPKPLPVSAPVRGSAGEDNDA